MQKINLILLSVFAIASMLLSACGGSAEVIQVPQPGENTVQPGGNTFVMPTFADANVEAQYNSCVERALATTNPERMITELTGHDETVELVDFKWCGNGFSQDDVVFMSAVGFAKLVPTKVDDVVVLGTATLWYLGEAVVVVAILATSYAVGAAAADLAYLHSNKDHSPTIAGSMARVRIDHLLTVFAAFVASNFSGKDPRENCGELRNELGQLIKVSFLFFDTQLNEWSVLWYWYKTPGKPWGGAYDKNPNGRAFEDGPADMKEGYTFVSGPDVCLRHPSLPGLQVAQP